MPRRRVQKAHGFCIGFSKESRGAHGGMGHIFGHVRWAYVSDSETLGE